MSSFNYFVTQVSEKKCLRVSSAPQDVIGGQKYLKPEEFNDNQGRLTDLSSFAQGWHRALLLLNSCTDLESFFWLRKESCWSYSGPSNTPQPCNLGSVTSSCALRVFAGSSPSYDELCSPYPDWVWSIHLQRPFVLVVLMYSLLISSYLSSQCPLKVLLRNFGRKFVLPWKS